MSDGRTDSMLYQHDADIMRKLKLGLLMFAAACLIFSLGSSQVAYVLDVIGVTGLKPISMAEIKAKRAAAQQAATTGKIRTRLTTDVYGIYVQQAGTPPKIDGEVADWNLSRGVLVVDDYKEHSGTMSMWCHLSYDEKFIYGLYRVRDTSPGGNSAEVTENPTKNDCVQFSMLTDKTAIVNIWQNSDQWLLQLHSVFSQEDEERLDLTAAGGRVAAKPHDDDGGHDIEFAVPWKVLAQEGFNGNPLPQSGQRIRVGFGARLSPDVTIGRLVNGPVSDKQLNAGLLWPGQFEHTLPVAIADSDLVFPTWIEDNRIKVSWDHPMKRLRTLTPEWLITPAGDIVIDGKVEDWPLTAGMVSTEDESKPEAGNFWLHGAVDAETLYILVVVQDPTPAQGGDAIELRLKNDRIRVLKITPETVLLDDQDLVKAGGKVATELWSDGAGYTVEAAVPRAAIGDLPTAGFPVTCAAAFNPSWTFQDLLSVSPERYEFDDPATWGKAVFRPAPPEPLHLTMPDHNLIPYRIEDGRPALPGGGWTVKPYATAHHGIDVLPGTAKIDGAYDEWDLSGGVFACIDVRWLRDVASAWFHAMYDDNGIYFLVRYTDPTPMAHRGVTSHRDDCCQIRFVTEHVLHNTLWAVDGEPEYLIETGHHGGSRQPRAKAIAEDEHGVVMAFKLNAQQTGYAQEIFFPWETLRPSGRPYKPGESCRVTFEIRTDLDFVTRDCLRPGSNYAMAWARIEDWGEARFRERGKIQPQPCQLWNHQQLPVTMNDGKPVVDWSKLQ